MDINLKAGMYKPERAAAVRAGSAGTVGVETDGDDAIFASAILAESHDPNIGRHLLRTRRLVAALCEELRFHSRFAAILAASHIDLIVRATPLHDIGKARLGAALLEKPGKLTADEMARMRTHAGCGRAALESTARALGGTTPFLRVACDIAGAHQEKWDGSGYPDGLAGDAIPLAARLMAAADVYDALVTTRSYRPAFTHETAIELIRQGRGAHFDPDVADAVLAIEERFRAIAVELADVQ